MFVLDKIIRDEIEEGVSYDYKYMIGTMDRVRDLICKLYNWIPPYWKCCMAIDNTCGRCVKEPITNYVALLQDKYNIEIIFQILCSPYTNVFDLGVRMSLYAIVERQRYLQRLNRNNFVGALFGLGNKGI